MCLATASLSFELAEGRILALRFRNINRTRFAIHVP